MALSAYPSCCGIYILTGFTYLNQESARKLVKDTMTSRQTPSCQIQVAFNDVQEANFGKMMLEEGWTKIVNGSWNKNHKSKIFVYAWVRDEALSNPDLFNADY